MCIYIHTHARANTKISVEKVQLVNGYIDLFKNKNILCGSHSFNMINLIGYRTFYISSKMQETELGLLRSIL